MKKTRFTEEQMVTILREADERPRMDRSFDWSITPGAGDYRQPSVAWSHQL